MRRDPQRKTERMYLSIHSFWRMAAQELFLERNQHQVLLELEGEGVLAFDVAFLGALLMVFD